MVLFLSGNLFIRTEERHIKPFRYPVCRRSFDRRIRTTPLCDCQAP